MQTIALVDEGLSRRAHRMFDRLFCLLVKRGVLAVITMLYPRSDGIDLVGKNRRC